MPMHDNVQFDIAEVLGYDETYNWNDGSDEDSLKNIDNLFTIKVRSCSAYIDRKTFFARPISNNIKNIPLVGELVLLLKSYNQYSTNKRTRETWYYVQTLNINSSLNDNRLPGISISRKLKTSNIDPIPGKTFQTKKISPLQAFEGDYIYEGRWGNSIRLGSTISTIPENYYHKSPSWIGDNNGDPIIVLSNGREYLENKEFVVEDINQDNSSIYLTSTQKIPIVLGNEENPNPLYGCITPNGNETEYIGSQLIGISDRVILKARADLAVIDSPMGIVLNSTGQIKLGSEEATESMVHGEVLLEILQNILSQLSTQVQCGSSTGRFINLSYANKASRQLQELLSSTYKMEFKPNK